MQATSFFARTSIAMQELSITERLLDSDKLSAQQYAALANRAIALRESLAGTEWMVSLREHFGLEF